MTKFLITYRDRDTGENIRVIREFCDTPGRVTDDTGKLLTCVGPISARQWAENWAYGAADKGPYVVKELR